MLTPRPRRSHLIPLASLMLPTVALISLLSTSPLWSQDSRVNDLPGLIKQLDDKVPDKRVEAAEKIGKLGPQALAAAPELIKRLDDMSITSMGDRVAPYYSKALAQLGPQVTPDLIKQLATDDVFRLAGVCEALHLLGPDAKEAVEVIVPQLEKVGGDKLWGFTYVLEGIGPDAAPAVPHLIKQLDNSDFQLQIVTCRTLAAIGPQAKAATDRLLQCLVDGNTSVKGHAALALGNIGVQPNVDIPGKLVETLENRHFAIRERVLEALGQLGPDAKSALPGLEKYLEDPSFNAKIPLAVAYYQISGDSETSLKMLTQVATTFETELEGVVALGKLGTAAEPAIPLLVEKLDSEDPDIVYETCFALVAIGRPNSEMLAKMDKLAQSDDEFVAEGARKSAEALRKIKP